MIYVVGSGPAGVACTMGLLAQGLAVTMLDYGTALEPETQSMVNQLRHGSRGSWKSIQYQPLKNRVSRHGVSKKLVFGSDFSYRSPQMGRWLQATQAGALPSFARGGLSTVWGAAMLPYMATDIADWPIEIDALVPFYREVLTYVPMVGQMDGLSAAFPLYTTPTPIAPSAQAAAVLGDWTRGSQALQSEGILFGQSRLALHGPATPDAGCRYCGHCLHGCPHDVIYSSAQTLDALQKKGRFHYVSGVHVDRIEERDGVVIIHGTTDKMESARWEGERVYLACGVLATTRLLLKSMESYSVPLTLKDSQYFLFPLLRHKGVDAKVRRESLHTLCQVFIEMFDALIDPNLIHLQLYGYNDLFDFIPFEPFLRRLFVIQGYLHSNASSTMTVSLTRGDGGADILLVSGNSNPDVPRKIKKVTQKLAKNRALTGMTPLSFLTQIQLPGRGFHSGGTFPMRGTPGPYETDIWGIPYGFKAVHVVDSTVLPSIPATTITLSVMANAHRIAAGYSQ